MLVISKQNEFYKTGADKVLPGGDRKYEASDRRPPARELQQRNPTVNQHKNTVVNDHRVKVLLESIQSRSMDVFLLLKDKTG